VFWTRLWWLGPVAASVAAMAGITMGPASGSPIATDQASRSVTSSAQLVHAHRSFTVTVRPTTRSDSSGTRVPFSTTAAGPTSSASHDESGPNLLVRVAEIGLVGLSVLWLVALIEAIRIPGHEWRAAGHTKLVFVFLMIALNVVGTFIYAVTARPALKRARG
jgi:hypothetical protein